MRQPIACLVLLLLLGAPAVSGGQTITPYTVTPLPSTEYGYVSPAWAADSQNMAWVGWSIWGPLRFLISGICASTGDIAGFFALPCFGCEQLYWDPTWSPDMTQLAFTENNVLLIASVNDTVITDPGGFYGRQPAWSPDGSRIAFVQTWDEIVTIPAQGGMPTHLAQGTNPAWSADSEWIAFDAVAHGHRTLWRIPSVGGQAEELPHGSGDAEHPTWSPDGELLAFSSNRDGNWDIWVMRIENGAVSRLTNDAAVEPDGTKIAFVSDRLGTSGIYIASDLKTVNIESVSWSTLKIFYR